jgi:hypothetical protein
LCLYCADAVVVDSRSAKPTAPQLKCLYTDAHIGPSSFLGLVHGPPPPSRADGPTFLHGLAESRSATCCRSRRRICHRATGDSLTSQRRWRQCGAARHIDGIPKISCLDNGRSRSAPPKHFGISSIAVEKSVFGTFRTGLSRRALISAERPRPQALLVPAQELAAGAACSGRRWRASSSPVSTLLGRHRGGQTLAPGPRGPLAKLSAAASVRAPSLRCSSQSCR